MNWMMYGGVRPFFHDNVSGDGDSWAPSSALSCVVPGARRAPKMFRLALPRKARYSGEGVEGVQVSLYRET